MGSPSCERIGLAHFLAPVATLRETCDPLLAVDLEEAARRFCAALARHRGSAAYNVRLRPPVEGLELDPLVRHLMSAADLLRQGDPHESALGDWSCALAARLDAVLSQPDPAVSRTLLFVDIDDAGLGVLVLVLVPFDPVEAATVPGLDEEPRA